MKRKIERIVVVRFEKNLTSVRDVDERRVRKLYIVCAMSCGLFSQAGDKYAPRKRNGCTQIEPGGWSACQRIETIQAVICVRRLRNGASDRPGQRLFLRLRIANSRVPGRAGNRLAACGEGGPVLSVRQESVALVELTAAPDV